MSKHEAIKELRGDTNEHDLGRRKGFLSLTKEKEAKTKRSHYIKILNFGILRHLKQ